MKNFIETLKKSLLIKRTTTVLFMAVLVALFIVLTLWLNSLDLAPIDLTSEKLYTLTDISKEKIKGVDKKINIYFAGYTESDPAFDLAKQYNKENNNITVETINTTDRPDLYKKYDLDTQYFSGVVVDCEGKYKIIESGDFYTYDSTTFEQIDITEEKLTNTIIYVISEKVPTVYFLGGYSDFTLNNGLTYLAGFLTNEVMEVKELNLLSEGNVPEDCDTLIITSPSKDFDDITTEALTNYINNGGNILWYNLLVAEKQDLPNVNKVLALYGIKPFELGIINETDKSKMMKDAPSIIIPNITYNSITKNVPSVLMVNATKINTVSEEELEELNVVKTDLLTTSEKAFFRTDFQQYSETKVEGEEEGSFVVGAEFDKTIEKATEENKGKVSKLIIYGENAFVTDYTLSQTQNYPLIMYLANRDLAMDSITYLVDRQEGEAIEIRKDTNKAIYTATEQQNSIIQAIIFAVPVIIVFAGILVWQHRRRKK